MAGADQLRRHGAHAGNAQRAQPAGERQAAGALEPGEHAAGVFLAEAPRFLVRAEVQVGELVERQIKEIQRGVDQPAAHQRLGDRLAQRFHIQILAAAEVGRAHHGLRRAGEIRAAPSDLPFLLRDRRAAARADAADGLIEAVGAAPLGAVLREHLHDSWDDLAGFLHEQRVADADVLALDFILIVQGCAGDDRPGQRHRIQLGHRRQHSRAPHLNGDGPEARGLLLGQKLEGGRPAGGSCR